MPGKGFITFTENDVERSTIIDEKGHLKFWKKRGNKGEEDKIHLRTLLEVKTSKLLKTPMKRTNNMGRESGQNIVSYLECKHGLRTSVKCSKSSFVRGKPIIFDVFNPCVECPSNEVDEESDGEISPSPKKICRKYSSDNSEDLTNESEHIFNEIEKGKTSSGAKENSSGAKKNSRGAKKNSSGTKKNQSGRLSTSNRTFGSKRKSGNERIYKRTIDKPSKKPLRWNWFKRRTISNLIELTKKQFVQAADSFVDDDIFIASLPVAVLKVSATLLNYYGQAMKGLQMRNMRQNIVPEIIMTEGSDDRSTINDEKLNSSEALDKVADDKGTEIESDQEKSINDQKLNSSEASDKVADDKQNRNRIVSAKEKTINDEELNSSEASGNDKRTEMESDKIDVENSTNSSGLTNDGEENENNESAADNSGSGNITNRSHIDSSFNSNSNASNLSSETSMQVMDRRVSSRDAVIRSRTHGHFQDLSKGKQINVRKATKKPEGKEDENDKHLQEENENNSIEEVGHEIEESYESPQMMNFSLYQKK